MKQISPLTSHLRQFLRSAAANRMLEDGGRCGACLCCQPDSGKPDNDAEFFVTQADRAVNLELDTTITAQSETIGTVLARPRTDVPLDIVIFPFFTKLFKLSTWHRLYTRYKYLYKFIQNVICSQTYRMSHCRISLTPISCTVYMMI